MADLYHGTFSYSTGPTAGDLLPGPQSEGAVPQPGEAMTASEKFHELEGIFQDTLKTSSYTHSSALPALSFSPIHALALDLQPFEEEPLSAIAFGNISPDNYIDMFWDIVKEQNEISWGRLAVYEAEESSEPFFLVCFKEQLFTIRYIRCDNLIREYSKIFNATDAFLEHPRNNIDLPVQDAVKMTRRGPGVREHLDEFPCLRIAYSYIKRWIAIRGLTNDLPDYWLFKHLMDYRDLNDCLIVPGQAGDPSSSALIAKFFMLNSLDSIPIPVDFETFRTQDWENLLVELNSLPLKKKLHFLHTIRVAVTYSGISPIKGAQWLLMVQRRFEKLKTRLENRIPNETTVQIWPQRLASEDAMLDDSVYEGHFVLGFRLGRGDDKPSLRAAQKIAEAWKQQVENDPSTLKDQCFVRVILDNIPDGLKICERKWPRIMLTGDNTNTPDSEDEPAGLHNKKVSKAPLAPLEGTSHLRATKAKRFRTASEVLNRLKFDANYNIDEWAIGYLDRVRDKILEKPASEWDRETTAEEFIPEHRIEHYKRYAAGEENKEGEERGEIMWSKKLRVDKIFKTD